MLFHHLILILIIIISIIIGTIRDSKNELFENQYIRDTQLDRNAINAQLYDTALLKKQDLSAYTFQTSNQMAEEIYYNTEPFNCSEVWGAWSNYCIPTKCDGLTKDGEGVFKRQLIYRDNARNGGTACESDTRVCITNNCPIDKIQLCGDWQNLEKGYKCLYVNGGIYMNGGEYTRNFVNGYDNCVMILLLWKDIQPSLLGIQWATKAWSGFIGINHILYPGYNDIITLSETGGISFTDRWGCCGGNNLYGNFDCDRYRATILISKNALTANENYVSGIFTKQPAMSNQYGISLNGGMLSRNFVDNNDIVIMAMTIWTASGRNAWNGFVIASHFNSQVRQNWIKLSSRGGMDLSTAWDGSGGNYLLLPNINEATSYKVNVLLSKNDFGTFRFRQYTLLKNTTLWTAYSISLYDNQIFNNKDLVNGKDQLVMAIIIWSNTSKHWSGFVSIIEGSATFSVLSNNTIALSNANRGYIDIAGADANDILYCRHNILITKK